MNSQSTRPLPLGACREFDVKDTACFTVRADGRDLTVRYSTRELKFLGGPLLPAGERFVQALGVFDNFTVAKGQNTLAWTTRTRDEVLTAAKELSESITRDQQLLAYDYQYSFSSQSKIKNTGGTGVLADGQGGVIDARQPGQVFLRITDGPVRDLRSGAPLLTDKGVVKIHRRKNTIDWLSKLTVLIEYLDTVESDVLQIRHHHPDDGVTPLPLEGVGGGRK